MKRIIFGVFITAAVGVGVYTGVTHLQPTSILTPIVKTGACINLASDAGIGRRPLDARTEAGVAMWGVTMQGVVSSVPTTLQIYDGDLSNLIASKSITSRGRWQQELAPLSLGWHKLIFRATYSGRTEDSVYWIGLATSAPTWTAPGPWESGADAGVVCSDAGCYEPGVVPRCASGPTIPSDAGILDALSDAWGDPIGCLRGCGALEYIKDAGCGEAGPCPGLTDSGLYYRPRCCRSSPGSNGWRHEEAWTETGIPGLASEIAAQPTLGSTLTIVSSASGDKGDTVMVYGHDAAGFVRSELLTTNATAGTTPVAGVIPWGTVAGVQLSSAITGTLTLTSTTGGQTVATISTAAPSKGIRLLANNRGNVINSQRVSVAADGATTAKLVVMDSDGTIDGVTLAGTTAVTTTSRYSAISLLALGAVPDARSLTLSAPAGWCSSSKIANGASFASQARGDILLSLNFAGLSDTGCGPNHLLVSLVESTLPWPPPPGDAGAYSYSDHVASRYRKYDYTCRMRRAGDPKLPVDYNRDAGANGVPFCAGGWCCVLSKIYPTPDAGS